MPNFLRKMKIREISSVDRGAGKDVKVILTKREEDDVDAYLKREFSTDQRRAAEKTGAAMPGGRYPIENESDLKNAIHAFGRGKDKPAVKRHIISRAKSLGLTKLIPENWRVSKAAIVARIQKDMGDDGIVMFDEAQAGKEADEYANGMMEEICEAICALRESVNSIQCEGGADKQSLFEQTFDQFKEHIQGVVPEEMEKSLNTWVRDEIIGKGATNMADKQMTPEEKAKAEAEAKAKENDEKMKKLKDENRELKKSLALATMTSAERQYFDTAGMPEELTKDFLKGDSAKRGEIIKAHPLGEFLPEHVRKSFSEMEELRKVNADFRAKEEAVTFAKRAVDCGLPEQAGETLRKAYRGDAEEQKKLEGFIKSLVAQNATAVIFKEFGTANGASGDPLSELEAKAAEYRKAHPELSKEQAFAKVYTDPANIEIVKRYKAA